MKIKLTGFFMAALLLGTSASPVFSGGPLIIFDPVTRTPYAYPVGVVPVYTDLGGNGLLTGPASDALTAAGFAEWTAVASSYFNGAIVGDFGIAGLPDINGFNAGLVVGTNNGGGIHVMYDDDGSIISNFFGAPPGVLGIASPDFATAGTNILTESWAVINGTAADPGDIGGVTFGGVFTHEFGHSINLAHTQINGAAGFFGDSIGPDGCATPYSGPLTLSDFETMYPFLDVTAGSTGGFQATVDLLDDIASISNVYPTAGWPASHGTITGKVFGPDGTTELSGVNVIARNILDPFKGAVSALSGDFTQGGIGPDGLFTFNGLVAGASYVVYIDEIVAGGFSTSPISIPGDGDEEYWNLTESSDPGVDDPCDYDLIVPVAGSPFTADIVVNGNASDLNLADDDFVEVSLPFSFPFCGTGYNSVFVGSNGFLTFGSGDTDFSESVAEFLNDQPRIAGLWDDLNPDAGGSITAEVVGPDFVVSYTNVPEFGAATPNSFVITLRSDGSYDVDYGTISALDGIAGRSTGGGATDPGETDLTAEPAPIGAGIATVYEAFTSFDNDLDGQTLVFGTCIIPDLPEIVVTPTSMSTKLVVGDAITKKLTISNLGDLDLNFIVRTSQGSGSPAQGGIIPILDLDDGGENPVLEGPSRLARILIDNNAASPGKSEASEYVLPLPHPFALSLLTENFNSGFPAGWSAIDNEGNGVVWQVPAQGGGNFTGSSGDAVGANSDFVGTAEFDTELRTPAVSGFGTNVVVSFVANYQNFGFLDFLDVDVSIDGGTNWTNVLRWNEDHGGFFGGPGEQVALNLDAVVTGAPNFIVRWRWYDPNTADFDWYVQIDDVMIVSDEVLTPCSFITVVDPDAGSVASDASIDVNVTCDATGFSPGTYDCELIIFSNAQNEPRLVVPIQLIVAHDVALDIKPGSCPNPFNVKLFEWIQEGAKLNKGGVLPVALVGSSDFDVSQVDISTIRLEGVAPSSKGAGPKLGDVATPVDNTDCACTNATADGIMDLEMKFQAQQIAEAIARGSHREESVLTMTGFLVDGTCFIASDCITFVGNSPYEPPPAIPVEEFSLGEAFPNPFNPATQIRFSLAESGPINLSIFDVKGRLVERLAEGVWSAGEHSMSWNARGLASGVYFYRLTAGSVSETRRLILLK